MRRDLDLKRRRRSKRISEMRNLGLAVENDLIAAGVFSSEDVLRLGVVNTFLKMLDGRKMLGRSAKCCSALYLYSIYGAIHDIDWRDVPSAKKNEFKILTEKLRNSGKYS